MEQLAVETQRSDADGTYAATFRGNDVLEVHHRYPWVLWLGLVLSIEAWIIAWYGVTFASMADIWWRSETFAHGLIVYPMCAWLIWKKRRELAQVQPQPCAWALVAMAGAGFGWLVASAGGVQAGQHVSLVALIALAPWAVLGSSVARVIAFPLAFTVFAAPIGEFLTPWMMQHTADFTVAALRLSGVPVFREGLQFIIPSGSWSVVEACSGLRYLIASVMLGCLYAYLSYRSPWRRTAFIALAFVAPIVANWFRAYLIVMIGHLSGNKLAVGVDHIIYGWVFFGIVMLIMFWVGSFWREDVTRVEGRSHPARLAPRGVPAASAVVIALMTAVTVAAWPKYFDVLEASTKARPIVMKAPLEAGGWSPVDAPPISFQPRYTGSRAQITETYVRGHDRVTLYVGYYVAQGEGTELINFNNTIVPSKDAAWAKTGEAPIEAVSGQLTGVQTQLKGVGPSLTVWHWYWVAGQWTASREKAKLLHAFARLTGQGDDAAIIAVYTQRDQKDMDESSARLGDFARAMLPSLQSMLEKVRSSPGTAASTAVQRSAHGTPVAGLQ